MSKKEELGEISYTRLGFEDHGFFTFAIGFDFGGSGQGIGDCILCARDADPLEMDEREKTFTAGGIVIIERILSAVGAEKWEDLVGKVCWVRRDGNNKIVEIEAPDFVKHRGAFNLDKFYARIKKKYPDNS